MSKKVDPFEKGLQDVFKDYQVPYKEGSWEEMEGKLATGAGSGAASWVAAIAAAVLITGVAAWYFMDQSTGSASATKAGVSRIVIEKGHYQGIRMKTERFLLAFAGRQSELDQYTTAFERNENEHALASRSHLASSSTGRPTGVSGLNADAAKAADANASANESSSAESTSSKTQVVEELPAVGDKPAVPISVSAREACAGTSVNFSIASEHVDGNYLWNFGDGHFSNEPNPSHTYDKAGVYDITLSVTSNEDGVIRTKTMDNLIVINPKPEADFDWTFVDSAIAEPVVRFNNRSQRAQQAQWVINNELNTDINPTEAFRKKGEHTVELLVSNEFGCEDKTARKIAVNADYALMAPSKFSPNDDGVFDTFMPRAFLNQEMDFTLKIYDGQNVIFETSNAQQPWKGQLPDGEMAEQNKPFLWVAIVKEHGVEKFYSGTVSITP
jgi:PKD repeat protein